MENGKMTVEQKVGKNWVKTFETERDVYGRLAYDLAAKYIGKSSRIKKITRNNNYDGTQTYTVYEAVGEVNVTQFRTVYTVELY